MSTRLVFVHNFAAQTTNNAHFMNNLIKCFLLSIAFMSCTTSNATQARLSSWTYEKGSPNCRNKNVFLKRNSRHPSKGKIDPPMHRQPSGTYSLATIWGDILFIYPNNLSDVNNFTLIIRDNSKSVIVCETFSTDQEEIEVPLPSSLKGNIYITIETDDYIYTGTTNF